MTSPQSKMDTIVEDKDVLFTEVTNHLEEVEASTTSNSSSQQQTQKELNTDLLHRLTRSLDSTTPQTHLFHLLAKGESLLQTLAQDPTPLTRLLQRIITFIPFSTLKQTISIPKITTGLNSPSSPIQLLCLTYIQKASESPSGASFVATETELLTTVINIWLGTGNTEVADRALDCLIELLSTDSVDVVTFVPGTPPITTPHLSNSGSITTTNEAKGQGLISRRLFQDRTIYELFYQWTSLVKSPFHDLSTKRGLHAATISQGRLFDFVVKVVEVGLDWGCVLTTFFEDIELEYSNSNNTSDISGQVYGGGLLRYVASGMIDENDYLMVVLRRDFFGKLVRVIDGGGEGEGEEQGVGNRRGVSPRLITAIYEGAGLEQQQQRTGMNGDGRGVNGRHL